MAEQKEDKWSSEVNLICSPSMPQAYIPSSIDLVLIQPSRPTSTLPHSFPSWLPKWFSGSMCKRTISSSTSVAVVSPGLDFFIGPLDDGLDHSREFPSLNDRVDGVLDVEFGKVLSQGKGSLHGIDASPGMISAAKKAVSAAGLSNCEFEGTALPSLSTRCHHTLSIHTGTNHTLTNTPPSLVLDATKITTSSTPTLHTQTFTKAFSNAALHWILRPPGSHISVFTAIRDALTPGGTFALEMGGLGNVAEMRTAIVMAVARRVGIDKAVAVDPWFFPDEAWLKTVLEEEVGGWEVLKVEREWRPTTADKGGVEGWVRLMGKELLDAVPEEEGQREEAVREIVEVLGHVCRIPGDGEMISYVRLRCLVRKL